MSEKKKERVEENIPQREFIRGFVGVWPALLQFFAILGTTITVTWIVRDKMVDEKRAIELIVALAAEKKDTATRLRTIEQRLATDEGNATLRKQLFFEQIKQIASQMERMQARFEQIEKVLWEHYGSVRVVPKKKKRQHREE